MSPSIYVLVKVSLLFMQLFWAQRDFLAYEELQLLGCTQKGPISFFGGNANQGVQTCFPLNSTASFIFILVPVCWVYSHE